MAWAIGGFILWIRHGPLAGSRPRRRRKQTDGQKLARKLYWLFWKLFFLPFILLYFLLRAIGVFRPQLDPDFEISVGERAGWTPKAELPEALFHLRAWMRRLAEPTYLFVPIEQPAFTKLGGVPDLPEGERWPDGVKAPCEFLLQIDFGEVPSKGPTWLPWTGRLYAFYDPEAEGAPDCVKILFAPPEVRVAKAPIPAGVEPFPERCVELRPFKSAPSIYWLGPKALAVDEEHGGGLDMQHEAAGIEAPNFAGTSHRLGGFPEEIQFSCLPLQAQLHHRGDKDIWREPNPGQALSPELEKEIREWRLLLQIDSDETQAWNWVDSGRLYVLIRRDDAAKGDFSRTVTLVEFH